MVKKKQKLRKRKVMSKISYSCPREQNVLVIKITEKKIWYLSVGPGPSRGDMSDSNVTWTIYISILLTLYNTLYICSSGHIVADNNYSYVPVNKF